VTLMVVTVVGGRILIFKSSVQKLYRTLNQQSSNYIVYFKRSDEICQHRPPLQTGVQTPH
jgi:hypothetical protein